MGETIQIPNFELEEEIGRGGMARVYLARQLEPRRKVAVKIVSPQRGDDPSFLQALKQEGDTVAQFSHENIVTVYACGVVDNHYYLAMEILSGGDLADKIEAGLSSNDALTILSEMASALAHAHQRKTLHRDIKPENILFHESGKAVLVDFGIAKDQDTESNFTKAGAVVGTPHYMAPERAQGKAVDARSDLYALGVVFYEMLTGEKMYQGGDTFAISYAHVYEPIPELPAPVAQYQSLLNRLVAKDPEDRFQSAEELLEKLKRATRIQTAPSDSADGATVVVSSAEDSVPTRPRPAEKPTAAPAKPFWQSPLLLSGAGVAIIAGAMALWIGSRTPGTTATGRELSIETETRINTLLASAQAQVRIRNFQEAELNYIKVLTEYDCDNEEARRGLAASNQPRLDEIIIDCE